MKPGSTRCSRASITSTPAPTSYPGSYASLIPAIVSPATAMSTLAGWCQSAAGVSARPPRISSVVPAGRRSVNLGPREPDHLAPPLGLLGDDPAELGGGAAGRRHAEVRQPRRGRRIGQDRVDLPVQL